MGFEGSGATSFNVRSPGGFEFGVQGWTWGPPVPKSITFFLDGSAMVCDQYGRIVRRATAPDGGADVVFADSPPDGNRENGVVPRPQFATHAQVVAALAAERIDWQAYEVRWRAKDGTMKAQGGFSLMDAAKRQAKLLQEGNGSVMTERAIACAGWPQLPYDQLKKMADLLPPTPAEELRKINDPKLRQDALRMRRELDEARMEAMTVEED